jgi:hypothetical protein
MLSRVLAGITFAPSNQNVFVIALFLHMHTTLEAA